MGGVSRWASVLVVRVVDEGAAWIFRTTSIPATTRPKAPEALPVRIAVAAEIERWLIVDADEPARRGAVGPAARHRHHRVLVQDAGDARTAASAIAGNPSFARAAVYACLDHLNLHGALGLVVHLHGAMEDAAVVMAPPSTSFRKFAVVIGALIGSTSSTMSPSSVCTRTRTVFDCVETSAVAETTALRTRARQILMTFL